MFLIIARRCHYKWNSFSWFIEMLWLDSKRIFTGLSSRSANSKPLPAHHCCATQRDSGLACVWCSDDDSGSDLSPSSIFGICSLLLIRIIDQCIIIMNRHFQCPGFIVMVCGWQIWPFKSAWRLPTGSAYHDVRRWRQFAKISDPTRQWRSVMIEYTKVNFKPICNPFESRLAVDARSVLHGCRITLYMNKWTSSSICRRVELNAFSQHITVSKAMWLYISGHVLWVFWCWFSSSIYLLLYDHINFNAAVSCFVRDWLSFQPYCG